MHPREKEAAAPWGRVYASLVTNGRLHTVTTLSVLAAHAATITRWLRTWDPVTLPARVEPPRRSTTTFRARYGTIGDEPPSPARWRQGASTVSPRLLTYTESS